jgi:dihydroneopterin aldolase
MDYILIRDLEIDCVIGVLPHERNAPQRIVLNLRLACDLTRAGSSDKLADTIDYAVLAGKIRALVAGSTCQLIEALAQQVAQLCLAVPAVHGVTVTLDKPGALPGARGAAVELHRVAE